MPKNEFAEIQELQNSEDLAEYLRKGGHVSKIVIHDTFMALADNEKIIESAIRHKIKKTIVTGLRHDHCFKRYRELFGDDVLMNTDIEQGFITTYGRFIGREEAWEIAIKENQVLPERLEYAKEYNNKSLNSEDLY